MEEESKSRSTAGELRRETLIVDSALPEQIQRNLRRWGWMGNGLRTLQITLAVVGTSAALAVTTFTTQLGDSGVKGLSFAAALAIGLLTAFNVGGKADSMRDAWRRLNAAVMRYQTGRLSIHALITVYEECEAIIGDVPFHSLRTLEDSAATAPDGKRERV